MIQLFSWLFNFLAPWLTMLGVILCSGVVATPRANALPMTRAIAPLSPQSVMEVKVSLGNSANELKFFPNQLEFVAGKRYKLILDNPSPQKHYFTAKDFADVSWTQKVEAGSVEIKGNVRELELKPQAEAEWVFVPMKSGTYSLRCPIPGHTEAGMTGTIIITDMQQSV